MTPVKAASYSGGLRCGRSEYPRHRHPWRGIAHCSSRGRRAPSRDAQLGAASTARAKWRSTQAATSGFHRTRGGGIVGWKPAKASDGACGRGESSSPYGSVTEKILEVKDASFRSGLVGAARMRALRTSTAHFRWKSDERRSGAGSWFRCQIGLLVRYTALGRCGFRGSQIERPDAFWRGDYGAVALEMLDSYGVTTGLAGHRRRRGARSCG
jgi:hypothetical protein